jgi:quinolinate synthase
MIEPFCSSEAFHGRPVSPWPFQPPLDVLLEAVEPLLDAVVHEDLGGGDPTTEAIVPKDDRATAIIRVHEAGIVAGLAVVERLYRRIDPCLALALLAEDGESVEPGDSVLRLEGLTRSILGGERAALNILQRMSGIATLTHAFARRIATTGAVILDTRKTGPGLRALDKLAVRLGGGINHRQSLADLGLIKDNHIAAAGGIRGAVEAVRRRHPGLPLEVEVADPEQLEELLHDPPLPPRILLDNFDTAALRRAVHRVGGRAVLEASGGVTLETVRDIAETGVDAISVGALTHSPRALDLSLDLLRGGAGDDAKEAESLNSIRGRLGERIVILGHHYQRRSVLEHADIIGDSLELARAAARAKPAVIVFCGVRFMGETAAILCRDEQSVVMPVPSAGCYLADCAPPEAITSLWTSLLHAIPQEEITPITYINSSIELKAFCGEHGGIACTSANAEKALRWALARTPRALFFPDQHLGRNAARAAGIPEERTLVWRDSAPPDSRQIRDARVVVWSGACDVHVRFRQEDVDRIRARHPSVIVLAHPECSPEVIARCDASGSTAQIIDLVRSAPPGAVIAIGTEARLVRRLQLEHPGKRIVHLAEVPPTCRSMTQTRPEDLLRTLREIERGESAPLDVRKRIAASARAALERMLEL